MANIKIKKGLDIPITGKPQGPVSKVNLSQGISQLISLNLSAFPDVKFKLLVRPEEDVKIGQPLAEDKSFPGRMFCSPAAGKVQEIRRGARRALQDIIIFANQHESNLERDPIAIQKATREQIVEYLKAGGMFAKIRSRPFNLLADPAKVPRAIFIKAIESAPFVPPAEYQIEGYEKEFQEGLNALSKLTDGKVHLVHRLNSNCKAFTEAKNVAVHTAEGPHPIANSSVHIQYIDPVKSPDDNIWILDAHTVAAIGYLLTTGKYLTRKIIGIGGPGLLPNKAEFVEAREGIQANRVLTDRIISDSSLRFISGDPLMGNKISLEDFLGFNHYAFSVIPENTSRAFLHFFRFGLNKYTFSKAYASGHLDNSERTYDFTTSLHGEHRAFIDGSLADEVMPLPVPTMLLVKAVMAEDYELADKLGFLSVDSEDFALPTFVCPSKVEMTEVISQGLKRHAADFMS